MSLHELVEVIIQDQEALEKAQDLASFQALLVLVGSEVRQELILVRMVLEEGHSLERRLLHLTLYCSVQILVLQTRTQKWSQNLKRKAGQSQVS